MSYDREKSGVSIKNILVAYNGSASSEAAMRLATLMYKKYNAHVTGLLAHQSAQAKLQQETWIPKDLKEMLGKVEASEHSKIKDAFLKLARDTIAEDRLHWIETYGSSDQTISDYSLLYDITVAGRRDVLVGHERYEYHPDRIASRSGRPVIVVPREYDVLQIHEHAVIAWDGNRAATHALWASMGILETKQRVTVLKIDTGQTKSPLPGIDVLTALARHGVSAELKILPAINGSTSKPILDYCDAEDAGLLVMGAFQTNSLREKLFGSTSKSLLEKSKIPILISG